MAQEKKYIGTGRRKSSTAQVVLRPGKGNITINGVDVRTYFPYETNVMDLKQPLTVTNTEETFDIEIDNDDAEQISTVGDAVEQIKNATNNN